MTASATDGDELRDRVARCLDERPPALAAIHAVVHDDIPLLDELAAEFLRRTLDDSPFAAVWLIVLPRSDADGLLGRIATAIRPSGPADDTLARLITRTPADAGVDALLDLLAGVPPRTAVLVAHAEYYHSVDGDEPRPRDNIPSPLGIEMVQHFSPDVWVPGVARLARALRARPWQAHAHIVLLVSKPPPTLPDHLDVLDSHFENQLHFSVDDRVDEVDLTARLPAWCRLLADRGIDELRAQVSAYSSNRMVCAQILAQCLAKSSRWEEAYCELAPLVGRMRVRPSTLLHTMAGLALNTARLDETRGALLELSAAELVDESELRNAHRLARQANDTVAQAALLARIRQDYPRARYLVRVQAIEHHLAGDVPGLLELRPLLQDDPELPSYAYIFVRAEHRCGRISRDELLAYVREHAPEQLEVMLAELVDEAIVDRRPADAWALLQTYRPEAANARVCVLAGSRLLQVLPLDPSTTAALQTAVLDLVLRFVADHPEDVDVRAALMKAVAVDAMGLAGPAMLLQRLQDASQVPPLATDSPHRPGRDVTNDELLAFAAFMRHQYVDHGPQHIMIAPQVVRSDRTEAEWRTLLLAAGPALRFLAGTVTDSDTVMALKLAVKATLDIWRTLRSLGADVSEALPIEVLHLFGQTLTLAGMFQDARDIAGLLLTHAGSHAANGTRRSGWIAHADIELRSSCVESAMLSLLCAQAQPVPALHPDERYNELELHIRLLRSLHRYEEALAWIPALRGSLVGIGEPATLTRKIDDLELGLRFLRLDHPVTADQRDELQALLAIACRSTTFAIAANEEVLVPTSWLAQLLQLCEASSVAAPAARDLFERALAELPLPRRTELRTLAGAGVDVDTLLRHAHAASQVRAAEDLGAHMERVRVDARRLLASRCAPEHALLAMELLADPTLGCGPPERSREDRRIDALHRRILRGYHFLTNGPDAAPEMHAVPEVVIHGAAVDASPASNTWKNPARLYRFACELGRGNLELVALAWQDERMMRVEARDGVLAGPVIDADGEAPRASPHRWRDAVQPLFDVARGTDPNGVAATREAMHGLGFTAPLSPGRRVLYLLAHPLAGLPANLLLRNGELSGSLGPVALVPSLSWLLERRGHPARGRGRHAWILPASTDDVAPRGPLALLADNLPQVLTGFTTEIGFPQPAQPLEVAVLAAHGGADPHGVYFSAVGDEQAHQFSIDRVATALAGCELVVLFVCSGGRTDAAPFSTRSVGLPSALLSAGCRAVIASPWPLDALVALRWVMLFLREWTGATEVDVAVYRANEQLSRYCCHPRDFLAMHVFGDPTLRASTAHAS